MGKHTKFNQSDDEDEKRDEKVVKRERTPEKSKHSSSRRDIERDRSPHQRNRDRDDYKERRRDDRRDDYRRDRDYKQDRGNRLSQEEIKAQRKALWGNKSKTTDEAPEEGSSEGSSKIVAKNEKLWSSAIAATGVDDSQANKFMRLMGVKSAPKPDKDEKTLSEEKNRQKKMFADLDRQFEMARESTHTARGIGLGFH
ncbi:unnamed protein product [Caenorhabditis bovis]|uniref:Small acidic protein-like domain-containing protein n=1 Tax=Caenorhabditis bovis TaxID=2654633 RepID=A0A8S1EH22_9PELO|nr:unnamed protein product [Caenorhabditis bovis]